MSEEYTDDLQKLYIEFLLAEKDLFVRCNAITQSKYFTRKYQPVMDFIQQHVDGYGDLPTHEQIAAKTSQQFDDITNKVTDDHKKWFMDEYEKFCRHKALEGAILASADKLERNEYGSVEKLIKDAVSIGLAKDFGLNYWDDPAGRIQSIKDNRGQNSTGWESLDKVLYGGFNPGELNIFAGGSGSGKSLFMQNMALNWALAGKNVVYVSLELSEELCSMRLDAMLTNMSTKDVMKNPSDVELKVKMASKKAGVLQIIQMSNGSTVNDITITGEFFVENDSDAEYWVAVVHFLRTMTKSFYGRSANLGNPPLMTRLNGYGKHVLNDIPVLIANFTVDLPSDVDYIPCSVGGEKNYVPTQSTITVTVSPNYARASHSRFSLESFANGSFVGKPEGFV